MIDSSQDREYVLSERAFAVSDGGRAYRQQPVKFVGRRGRLSAEEAAQRREEGRLASSEEVSAAETVPSAPVAPADPTAALRHARLGFFAAATLVLLLVWVMQRRKGG